MKNESFLTRSLWFSLVGGCEDKENPPTSRKDSLVVVVAGRWVQRRRTSQNDLFLVARREGQGVEGVKVEGEGHKSHVGGCV